MADGLNLDVGINALKHKAPLCVRWRRRMALNLFADPLEYKFSCFVGVGVLKHLNKQLLVFDHLE